MKPSPDFSPTHLHHQQKKSPKNKSPKNKSLKGLIWMLILIGLGWLLTEISNHTPFRIMHQQTPSMPEGWYIGSPLWGPPIHNETVFFTPPDHVKEMMESRAYLPTDAVLIKKIMGIPGDNVCLKDGHVWLNGVEIGILADTDRKGRPLPQIHLCEILPKGLYFLMSNRIPNSFDSRYFGLVPSEDLLGKAHLVLETSKN